MYTFFLSWEFPYCSIVLISPSEEKLESRVEEATQFAFSWKRCSCGSAWISQTLKQVC